MNTKYRLVPIHTHGGIHMYLQFCDIINVAERTWWEWFCGKPVNIVEKEVWRFIPKRNMAIFECYNNYKKWPISLPFGYELNFYEDFVDQIEFNCIPFTKKYPDIFVYSSELFLRHTEFLAKKKRERDAQIKYL